MIKKLNRDFKVRSAGLYNRDNGQSCPHQSYFNLDDWSVQRTNRGGGDEKKPILFTGVVRFTCSMPRCVDVSIH